MLLNPSARAVLSDPELCGLRNAWFRRLRDIASEKPAMAPVRLNGIWAQSVVDPYTEPERWVEEGLNWLAGQAPRLRDEGGFRPPLIEFELYGVHFIDRLLGAHVFDLAASRECTPHGDETGDLSALKQQMRSTARPDKPPERNWQVHVLDQPVGQLRTPDLRRDATWDLARRVVDAFLAAEVTLPLFGLPVIASPLNVAVNLYGQEFLFALFENPAGARHDLEVINDLLCRLHRWYRRRLPARQLQSVVAGGRAQPPGCGQLCGCTTHVLSAELYTEFIAPLDAALLAVYPHGGLIHLCGHHTQHLPTWRAMSALRAVQLNDTAADDFETYWHGLRDDQVIYFSPTARVSSADALRISGGRRLVLVEDWPERKGAN